MSNQYEVAVIGSGSAQPPEQSRSFSTGNRHSLPGWPVAHPTLLAYSSKTVQPDSDGHRTAAF